MLRDAFALALRALRRNLLRSSLTVLGIVIGVAAVIVMVTLGSGTTSQVTASISSLGSNILMVTPGRQGGLGQGAGTGDPFHAADAEALAREVSSASAIAPVANASVTAVYGNENWSTTVTGTSADWFTVHQRALAAGRTFTESELRSGTAVCVIGATVRQKLFGAQDPLGRTLRVYNVPCEVVGVLQTKGQSAIGSDQDDAVVMPPRAVQRRLTGSQDIREIQVAVREGVSTARAQREIAAALRERRHLSAAEADDFRMTDMAQIGSTLTRTTTLLTELLSAVAAVSLLVGGIGIMNIMLVSVTERTREIGIRLAIGAMARDVLTQFLVEAVVLSFLGGLIGIVLALSASYALASLLKIPFVTDVPIIVIALLFSAAVGVVFGYFPARNAARLDPIEALRHE